MAWPYIAMGPMPPSPCWSAWNESGRCNLALRQMPDGFFPQRLLCSRCHGDTFEEDRLYQAVVEEISTIRHMLGQTDWQPRRIARLRTSDGQRITGGLTDESGPGTLIHLFDANAAPFGPA